MFKNKILNNILIYDSYEKLQSLKYIKKKIKIINKNIKSYKYYNNLLKDKDDISLNNNIIEELSKFNTNKNNIIIKKNRITLSPHINNINNIKQIYKKIFNNDKNNNCKKEKNFIKQYYNIIDSASPLFYNNFNTNKKISSIKIYKSHKFILSQNNEKENYINRNKPTKFFRSHTLDYININKNINIKKNENKNMNIGYRDSKPVSIDNFKHPKIYILNRNKKLPLIKSLSIKTNEKK